MALPDDKLDQASAQLTAFRKSDELSSILNNYAALLEDYAKLKSDYEEARDARDKYKSLSRSQDRNPFALVLIDGDGYVFNDIHNGGDAGTLAAQQLNKVVHASLRRKGIDCQIMVRVFANVAGLSTALHKAGLIGSHNRAITPFIAGFNRSFGLADFVDAGELKENADSKIRALLNLYAANAQCRHIFFAACHDVGYINDLTPHAGNRERFTLVDSPGIRFHEQFVRLGLGIEELPGIFRAMPIDGVTRYVPKTSEWTVVGPPSPVERTRSAASSGTPICHFYPLGKCKYGKACKNIHDEKSRSEIPLRKRKSFEAPDFATLLPPQAKPGYIAINKYDARLDPYIPAPSANNKARLMDRINTHQLCNKHHLANTCEAPSCPYDHDPLPDEIRGALEWLARTQPCPRHSSCRDEFCTKGHICQNAECKRYGGKATCRLSSRSHEVELAFERFVPAVLRRAARSHSPLESESTSPTETIEEVKEEVDAGGAGLTSPSTPSGSVSMFDQPSAGTSFFMR